MFADMAEINWSSNIVPYGADQTLYLVIDRIGGSGTSRREIEVERTDMEAAICDLMQGQFNDPVRVVAFNTLEHWAKDVSAEIAFEIQSRCDMDGNDLPEHIKEFVKSSTLPTRRSPALISSMPRSAARARR
jgi:hypothetical protein